MSKQFVIFLLVVVLGLVVGLYIKTAHKARGEEKYYNVINVSPLHVSSLLDPSQHFLGGKEMQTVNALAQIYQQPTSHNPLRTEISPQR